MPDKKPMPATDSARELKPLVHDDVTADFENDPKFVDSNPTENASSENLASMRDTDDEEDSDDELEDEDDDEEFEDDDEDDVDDEDAEDDDELEDDDEEDELDDDEDDDEEEDDEDEVGASVTPLILKRAA
ncbi:MAG TPA: hypothetical protein VGM11_02605 [Acidobacteriaceae bacterium]|jgi:hypothetical protein